MKLIKLGLLAGSILFTSLSYADMFAQVLIVQNHLSHTNLIMNGKYNNILIVLIDINGAFQILLKNKTVKVKIIKRLLLKLLMNGTGSLRWNCNN